YTASPDVGASFVIVTTEANPAVAPLHHRMPVIVPKAHLQTWLSPATGVADAEALLVPYTGAMRIYPVSTQVNSPRHTDADCIAPIAL
ncbi:MAG: SOS response-associated peptidase, partial [Deltaproteobacteria bacterium]